MAIEVRLRAAEGSKSPQPYVAPDLGWNPQLECFDLVLDADGLPRTEHAIETAIIIQLFTDARANDDERPHGLSELTAEPRGWWGDTIDVRPGETPWGTKAWTLVREPVNNDTLELLRSYTIQALETLVSQGLAARVDVDAGWRPSALNDRIVALDVKLYGIDGRVSFTRQFDIHWQALQ